ncbi:MAG: hypothetical protein WC712_12420 [Candidatus Brocadiia bacterium]
MNAPPSEDAVEIGEFFSGVVDRLRDSIPPGGPPVDIELKMGSVVLTRKGLFVTARSEQSSFELRLATRVHPRDVRKEERGD